MIRDIFYDIFDVRDVEDDTVTGDGSADEEESGASAPQNMYNPITDMLEDHKDKVGEKLEPMIFLNSSGFAIMVTNKLLVALTDAVLNILGGVIGTQDGEELLLDKEVVEQFLDEIMSSANLGLFFDKEKDGNFSLKLNLSKDSGVVNIGGEGANDGKYQALGYSITLSLLHDTVAVISTDTFDEYYRYLTEDDEMMKYYGTCFDARDVEWRINAGLDITISTEFTEYILNWSSLFANELDENGNAIGAAFYLQALENMKGDVTMRLKFDIKLTDIDKWGINAMIQFISLNSDGTVSEEFFALYILGSLNETEENYANDGLKIYLTMSALRTFNEDNGIDGVDGILINSDTFVNFLNLNLQGILDGVGEYVQNNVVDGILETLWGLIGSFAGGDDSENNDSEQEVQSPDNAPEGEGAEGEGTETPDDPYTPEEEETEEASAWYLNLLDSIQFSKGAISIVVAKTALETILQELFNFPFEEGIGGLKVNLNNIDNYIELELGLDRQEEVDLSEMTFKDLEYSIAEKAVVKSIHSTIESYEKLTLDDSALANPFLTGVMTNNTELGQAQKGYFGEKELSILAGTGTTDVYYLLYDVDEYFVAQADDTLETKVGRANTMLSDITNYIRAKQHGGESLFILEGSSGNYYSRKLKTNIAMKVLTDDTVGAKAYVMVAVAINSEVESAPINVQNVTIESFDDREATIKNVEETLAAIRYLDSQFIVGLTANDKPIAPNSAFLITQDGYNDKDFALENSAQRNIYYLVFDPTDYYAITGDSIEEKLLSSQMNSIELINILVESFKGRSFEWTESPRAGNDIIGTQNLVYSATHLSVAIRSVLDTEAGYYKVIVGVVSNASMYNVALRIGNIDIGLGGDNIFANTPMDATIYGDKYHEYLDNNFKQLNEFKWEFGVNLEFKIDDTVGGFFDMSSLITTVMGLIGGDETEGILAALGQLNLALQPAEDIDIAIGIHLRVFIDFGDITPLRFQLAITHNHRNLIQLTYEGRMIQNAQGELVERSVIYADLSGLGFPAMKLEGLQVGKLVKDILADINADSLLGGSTGGGESTEEGGDAGQAINNGAVSIYNAATKYIDRVDLKDYAWDNRLLLMTMSYDEVTIAVTGALVYSLLGGIAIDGQFNVIKIPMFRNLVLGYSEKDNISGLEIRLTDDTPYEEAFRIGFHIRKGYYLFGTDVEPTITPYTADIKEEDFEDISVIDKVGLTLGMELRIRTKDGEEKSPQLEAIEALIENLVSMPEGSVVLDPQDSVMVFGLELSLYTSLKDFSETTLRLALTFAEEDILAIYYMGDENRVYADLTGLGFFQTTLTGVDLLGILTGLVGGLLGTEGIQVTELINGVFDIIDDTVDEELEEGIQNATDAQNAAVDLITSTNAPLIRILMSNDELIINPSISVVQLLLGDSMKLPNISDIRLSTNISYGLNNLAFRIKLDPYGNYVNANVSENMFKIAIGNSAEELKLKKVKDPGSYSGVVGITLGLNDEGGLYTGFDIGTLVSSLVDTLKFDDFAIYLEKRNDYYFMRNLKYGGTGTLSLANFALSPNLSTGPTYFSDGTSSIYDKSFDTADSKGFTLTDILALFGRGPIEIFGLNVTDMIGLGTGYQATYFNNAYRRVRLSLNKTADNGLEINIKQLTQVSGSYSDMVDQEDWKPQEVTAFTKENVLHVSLQTILVIDLTGLIDTIVEFIIDKALGAAIEAIITAASGGALGAFAGPIKTAITSLLNALVSDAIASALANLIADSTGYGNPLEIGRILDDVLGKGAGGIPITSLYMPTLLAGLTGGTAEYDDQYGSLYGTITGPGPDGREVPVAGATVRLNGDLYTTTTNADGFYSFINVPVGNYSISIIASSLGYNDKPQIGEAGISATVRSYSGFGATEANFMLNLYQTPFIGEEVNISGKFSTQVAGNSVSGVDIYFQTINSAGVTTGWNKIATTDASGNYTAVVNNVYANYHGLQARRGGYTVATASVTMNPNSKNYTVNLVEKVPSVPTSGSISGRLVTYNFRKMLEGKATEVYANYASNGGEEFPTNALTAINNALNPTFFNTLVSRGGTFTGVTVKEGVIALTYEFEDDMPDSKYENGNIDKAVNSWFMHLNSSGFRMESLLSNTSYHGESETHKANIDFRAIRSQNTIIVAISAADFIAVTSGVELWIEIQNSNGTVRTIRNTDSYDGKQVSQVKYSGTAVYVEGGEKAEDPIYTNYYENTPRDYLSVGRKDNKQTDFEAKQVLNSDGRFTLDAMAFNTNYVLKVRSATYNNRDLTDNVVLLTSSNLRTDLGEIVLTKRAPHWSETKVAGSMLQGLRLRLGADKLDENSEGIADVLNPGYTADGIPMTMYSWLASMTDETLNALAGWGTGTVQNVVGAVIDTFVSNSILNAILGAGVNAGIGALGGLIPSANSQSPFLDAVGKPIFVPWDNYVTGFESAAEDRNDAITYIEAWVSSDMINGIFMMVNNMILPLIGYNPITPNQQYTAADLCAVPEGTNDADKNLLMYNGIFDESDDEKIYDYVYANEGEYASVMNAFGARIAGGVLSTVVNLLPSIIGQDWISKVFGIVQMVLYSIEAVRDILDQVTRLISHILPLTLAYNMYAEKDLENSPLTQQSVVETVARDSNRQVITKDNFATSGLVGTQVATQEDLRNRQISTNVGDLVSHSGALAKDVNLVGYNYTGITTSIAPVTKATEPKLDDDGDMLEGYYRDLDFHDMSVYAKVVLNSNVTTLLDRIVLFINGASYENHDKGKINEDSKYYPNGTLLRADTVLYDEEGQPLPEYKAVHEMVQKWIATNIVNSYLVINDYRYETNEGGVTTRRLVGTTYVRDVFGHFDDIDYEYGDIAFVTVNNDDGEFQYYEYRELTLAEKEVVDIISAKNDWFLEVDINNTGVGLRAVTSLGELFYAEPNGTSPMTRTYLNPPETIIFHDPYNMLDFTAFGGTWANEGGHGGIRHNVNEDGTYTVTDITKILPNRCQATFKDGSSDDSTGVTVYWDFSAINWNTQAEDGAAGQIKGYVANMTLFQESDGKTVSKINTIVEKGVVVDPNSTLHIEYDEALGRYVEDEDNNEKIFDLPEIDPMNFDLDAYVSALPTQFAYAAKMEYVIDGVKQVFKYSDGTVQDYVFKRYVFNKLSWDFSKTEISYKGGTAYAELTYWYEPSTNKDGAVKGEASKRVTVKVPVRVKSYEAVKLNSVSSSIGLNLFYEANNTMVVAISAYNEIDRFANVTNGASFNMGDHVGANNEYLNQLLNGYGFNVSGSETIDDAYYNSEDSIVYLMYNDVTEAKFLQYVAELNNKHGYEITVATDEGLAARATAYNASIENATATVDLDKGNALDKSKIDEELAKFGQFAKYNGIGSLAGLYRNDEIGVLYVEYTGVNAANYLSYVETLNTRHAMSEKVNRLYAINSMSNVEFVYRHTSKDGTVNTFLSKDETMIVALVTSLVGDRIVYYYNGANKGGFTKDFDGDTLVFNPLDNIDVKSVVSQLKTISLSYNTYDADGNIIVDATGAPVLGTIKRWKITGIEYSSLDEYDPKEITEQKFPVVITVQDVLGNKQNITIYVQVLDRQIKAHNLDTLIPQEVRTINPFSGADFALPSAFEVDYGYALLTLKEGKDFVWEYDVEEKKSFNYQGTTANSWEYVIKAVVGEEGYEQYIPITYTINRRIPTGVKEIAIYPYASYTSEDEVYKGATLNSEQDAEFFTGSSNVNEQTKLYYQVTNETFARGNGTTSWDFVTVDEEKAIVVDGIKYYESVEFKNVSYDGEIYHVNVLFIDEIFGKQIVKNVRVKLLKTTVSSLNIPAMEISPYYSDEDINKILFENIGNISANVYGVANTKLWNKDDVSGAKAAFDIIGWSYVDKNGLYPDGRDVTINVVIGNKGYKANDVETQIWSQELPFTFTKAGGYLSDKTVAEITPITQPGSYKLYKDNAGKYVFEIQDPYTFELPAMLNVVFKDGDSYDVPVAYDMGANKDKFYTYEYSTLEGAIIVGTTMINNKNTVEVTYMNVNPRKVLENGIKYFYDEAHTNEFSDSDKTFYALDGVELPKYATVDLYNQANSKNETLEFDVEWTSVTTYSANKSDYVEGKKVLTATAKMGNSVFGYIINEVKLTVIEEHVSNYVLNSDRAYINPYYDVKDQIVEALGLIDNGDGTVGILVDTVDAKGNALRNGVKVDVALPQIPMGYQTTSSYNVELGLGRTVDFGGVTAIVDDKNNKLGTSIEVREYAPFMAVVEARVAIGIETWYGENVLTGSVYEQIDFASLDTSTVIAVGRVDSDRDLFGGQVGYKAITRDFLAEEKLANVWPEGINILDESLEALKLNGRIIAVYQHNDIYYVWYQGALNIKDAKYRQGIADAGYQLTETANGYHSYNNGIAIDVASYDEGLTILFENGAYEDIDVEWDVSSLRYTFLGGNHNVKATLKKGDALLEQTFTVRVDVKPSKLYSISVTSAGLANNSVVRTESGKITSLQVDPYVGFVGLPEKVLASFDGTDGYVEVAVSWSFERALANMTTLGGEFNKDNNMAAIASIYVMVDGARTAIQSIEIPVEVINRELISIYVLNSKTNKYEAYTGSYEINPYETLYSEDFDSTDFSYFRKVLLRVKSHETDGDLSQGNLVEGNTTDKEIVFDLTAKNYKFVDSETGGKTNLDKLYTGRLITVEIEASTGNATAARDAVFSEVFITRILDMRYVSGLNEAYFIDPYGVLTGKDVEEAGYEGLGLRYDDKLNIYGKTEFPDNKLVVNNINITTEKITYPATVEFDTSDAYTKFVDGKAKGEIDFSGGRAKLYATLGNEIGGYQRIEIPVIYVDRTIKQLFSTTESAYADDTDENGNPVTMHFKFDPFDVYDATKIYPQSGTNVIFTDNSRTTFGTTGLSVEWDDEKVAVSYRGSEKNNYVKATVSYNGKFEQVLKFSVLVYDRTVTGFTDVYKYITDENGNRKYKVKTDYAGNIVYQTDEEGNVLKDENGNPIPEYVLDSDGNKVYETPIIQPYKYLSSTDLMNDIVNDIFRTNSAFTIYFGNMGADSDKYAITFTLGATASSFVLATDAPNKDLALTTGDESLVMRFVADSARGISYKGKDARFYITIPGFGMGTSGRQVATFDVECAESYILGIRFQDSEGNYTMDFERWLNANDDIDSDDIVIMRKEDAEFYDTYYIHQPYMFINRGGVLLPETAMLYVGKKDGNIEDPATYTAVTDTYWSNMFNGRARIKYNENTASTTFQVDLDYQNYALEFIVNDAWALTNDVVFDEDTLYGREEVILMPTQNKVSTQYKSQVAILEGTQVGEDDNGSVIYANDSFIITYMSGETTIGAVEFGPISSSGNNKNMVNKWNFEDVDWDADRSEKQYATLKLGGEGGQVIRWGFRVDKDKKLVNNSVATLHSMEEGQTITLDRTYKQLFGGSTLAKSPSIFIDYTSGMHSFYNDETKKVGVERVEDDYVVTATALTPAKKNLNSELDAEDFSYPGYVEWSATRYRAYPDMDTEIGGRIIFVCYREPIQQITETEDMDIVSVEGEGGAIVENNLGQFPIVMHNPDADYGSSLLRPRLPSTWDYKSSFSKTGQAIYENNGRDFMYPDTKYKVTKSGGRWVQSNIPKIEVEENAYFDLKYLPHMSLRTNLEDFEVYGDSGILGWNSGNIELYQGYTWDYLYAINWAEADVYYTADKGSWNAASNNFNSGSPLTNGFADINTGKDQAGSSRVRGMYTIRTYMTIGGETIPFVVALEIVKAKVK